MLKPQSASVWLQHGTPISKAPVAIASQKGGRKRAKLSHDEHATLLTLHDDLTSKASELTPGNQTNSSKHNQCFGFSAQPAGSSESYGSENYEAMPHDQTVPLQKYMLQAKGVAPHVVYAVNLQQQQGNDSLGTALTVLDKHGKVQLLMSVIQKSIAAAQECVDSKMSVVAVDVQLVNQISKCHIICYHL